MGGVYDERERKRRRVRRVYDEREEVRESEKGL